jgi:hypothetical protein
MFYKRPSDDRTRNRSNEESGVAQTKPIALEDKRKKQAPAFFKSWQRDSRSKSLVYTVRLLYICTNFFSTRSTSRKPRSKSVIFHHVVSQHTIKSFSKKKESRTQKNTMSGKLHCGGVSFSDNRGRKSLRDNENALMPLKTVCSAVSSFCSSFYSHAACFPLGIVLSYCSCNWRIRRYRPWNYLLLRRSVAERPC